MKIFTSIFNQALKKKIIHSFANNEFLNIMPTLKAKNIILKEPSFVIELGKLLLILIIYFNCSLGSKLSSCVLKTRLIFDLNL